MLRLLSLNRSERNETVQVVSECLGIETNVRTEKARKKRPERSEPQ